MNGTRRANHSSSCIPTPRPTLAAKPTTRLALQREFGLPADPVRPALRQHRAPGGAKGVDILLGALEEMLARRHPVRAAWAAARRISAGLPGPGPSLSGRRSPCSIGFDEGLVAPDRGRLRFLPHALAVRAVRPEPDVQPALRHHPHRPRHRRSGRHRHRHRARTPQRPTASSSREYSSRALAKAIRKALALYQDRECLQALPANAMTADFSWEPDCPSTERYMPSLERARPEFGASVENAKEPRHPTRL